jgi:hypothetical protein
LHRYPREIKAGVTQKVVKALHEALEFVLVAHDKEVFKEKSVDIEADGRFHGSGTVSASQVVHIEWKVPK